MSPAPAPFGLTASERTALQRDALVAGLELAGDQTVSLMLTRWVHRFSTESLGDLLETCSEPARQRALSILEAPLAAASLAAPAATSVSEADEQVQPDAPEPEPESVASAQQEVTAAAVEPQVTAEADLETDLTAADFEAEITEAAPEKAVTDADLKTEITAAAEPEAEDSWLSDPPASEAVAPDPGPARLLEDVALQLLAEGAPVATAGGETAGEDAVDPAEPQPPERRHDPQQPRPSLAQLRSWLPDASLAS
ncbi:hypothetical protein EVJ50_00425 [Synechococcus sp. RSCCF101]|uniref:hypothetical protein n=1 Tax=Synechococcus sp. RSCCF101 TaxID=2511069 RepID=UPI00124600A5|nr:hypothetical protein [Synechococcus sp. RSCCF101]QEY30948.1 hypothetical protein EVJ50_00425 [Synechococcus sp. RSCCF101]